MFLEPLVREQGGAPAEGSSGRVIGNQVDEFPVFGFERSSSFLFELAVQRSIQDLRRAFLAWYLPGIRSWLFWHLPTRKWKLPL